MARTSASLFLLDVMKFSMKGLEGMVRLCGLGWAGLGCRNEYTVIREVGW